MDPGPRNIQAELGLGKFKEALKDFRVAYSLRPNDRDALSKLKHCESMVRRQAFEAAIRTEVKQQRVWGLGFGVWGLGGGRLSRRPLEQR